MAETNTAGRQMPVGTETAAPRDAAPLALQLRGITKRFGPLTANDAIDLDVHEGEVVVLLGENGAGKTTLMNVLFGHYVAEEGRVMVRRDGVLDALAPGEPAAALEAGIGMVHQHFTLAENLTALENILLGTESILQLRVGRDHARDRLQKLMAHSGLSVALDRRVSRLSVGEKQRVEILKALYRNARVLVLDEPTAVLTPQEAQTLFATLRALTSEGLAVILITHKMAEVFAIADRVAVLRGGAKVGDRPTSESSSRELAELMVGRTLAGNRRRPGIVGDELMRVHGLSGGVEREAVHEISFGLRQGEILGIAGVSGNGQAMLARLLSGLERPRAGKIVLHGKTLGEAGVAGVAAAGIARVPEDRHRDGVVGAMSVAENLVIESIRSKQFQKFGFLRFEQIARRAEEAIARYDIRCPGPSVPVQLLSGGNMQKVILARTLDAEPAVLIAAQPTRGLDVGATEEVHNRLLQARDRDAGIILISEDLDELLQLSDRIAVMHAGRLWRPEPTEWLDRSTLGLRMAGQAVESQGGQAA